MVMGFFFRKVIALKIERPDLFFYLFFFNDNDNYTKTKHWNNKQKQTIWHAGYLMSKNHGVFETFNFKHIII